MRKFEKILCHILVTCIHPFKLSFSSRIRFYFLRRWGVKFSGEPAYISPKVWFDGANYSQISIGDGVTISSYVRLLTHDWSMNTVLREFNVEHDKPIGRLESINIDRNTFIGTGTIIMPGSNIGKGVIIGAGTVVRGNIPDYSICIGSPCKIIGNTKDYLFKKGYVR